MKEGVIFVKVMIGIDGKSVAGLCHHIFHYFILIVTTSFTDGYIQVNSQLSKWDLGVTNLAVWLASW